MNDNPNRGFGYRLKQLRKHFGYTQTQAAEVCGIGQVMWSNCEIGKNIFSAPVLARIAMNTGVSLSWLLAGIRPMFVADVPSVYFCGGNDPAAQAEAH